MSTEQLAKWLRIAIKQNEHDMILTDEEIREARAALAAHEAEKAQAVLPNGLTEAETAASASVFGLMLPKKAAPAAPVAVPIMRGEEIQGLLAQAEYLHPDIPNMSRADFINGARHAERYLAARWGVKLEGGQG